MCVLNFNPTNQPFCVRWPAFEMEKVRHKARLIKRLRASGFGRRVIDEGIADPYGLINLTLKYGYKRAKEIRLEHERRRIRR